MSWAHAIVRPEILSLPPLVLDDAAEDALVHAARLHANENAYACSEPALHHYPHMYARTAEHALAALYGVHVDSLLVSRGSDEGIDLLVRTFCRQGADSLLQFAPTFPVYAHAAHVQGVQVRNVALQESDFALSLQALTDGLAQRPKLVFFCSPNNPTGTSIDEERVALAAAEMRSTGLVIVDEAYVEFSRQPSMLKLVERFPNVVVLRTLSKARGLAGARVGALVAAPEVIELLRRVRLPYCITSHSMKMAIEAASEHGQARSAQAVACTMQERAAMYEALLAMPGVERVWPSDANFHLIRHERPERVVQLCALAGIAVRAFSGNSTVLARCLRLTVGTPEQNQQLRQCLTAAMSPE